MLMVSEGGRLLDANPLACALLGRTREELLRADLRAVADPTDRAWEEALSERGVGGARQLRFVGRGGGAFEAWVAFTRPARASDRQFGLIFRKLAGDGAGSEARNNAARVDGVLFENGPNPIILYEAGDTICYASPSVERLLGYEPDELTGVSISDVVHPDDLGLAARETQKTASVPGRQPLTLRYRHKDSSWVRMDSMATDVLHDPDVEGMVIDGHDVAERGQEEEAPRRGERRNLMLVSDPTRAMTVLEPDATFRYVSPAAQRALGYAPEELVGRDALGYVHQEDRRQAREILETAIRQGSAAEVSAELRLEHGDGSWHHFRMKIVDSPDGPGVGALVAELKDVTEQKETEEALRQSEGRYRAVVDQTNEGVYLADAGTMRVLEANKALQETLGYTEEELRRLTLYDLVADDRAGVDEYVRRTLQEKRSHIDERKYRRKDGSLACVEEYAGIVPHEGTEVLCVVVDDVTERKRTEENLRRSLGVLLALREAGQVLGSTLEAEEIVTRLLMIMRGVSGLTAAVISVENELGQPRIWREVGLEGLWRRARYAPQAEEARRAVLDAGEHQLFRLRGPESSGQLVGLCLPLRMKDRIAGVLEAYGPESLAGEDAVEILRSLAAQAASALENARLYGELAERERRLADLIGQLFTAQEEERRRVAYEVHDGLAQVAAAAHQHLQGFARFYPPGSEDGRALLSQALELVQRTVGEARRVIANLRPTALDDFGLGTALRIEADRLRAEGYRIDYENNLGEDERLPVAVETALFRITQEALTNVRRHANTRRVRVTLDRLRGRVHLNIRDWGRGFDPEVPRVGDGPGERVGLNSMQERVALLGGSFLVQSRPGGGVLVTVEVPLSPEDPDREGDPIASRDRM